MLYSLTSYPQYVIIDKAALSGAKLSLLLVQQHPQERDSNNEREVLPKCMQF